MPEPESLSSSSDLKLALDLSSIKEPQPPAKGQNSSDADRKAYLESIEDGLKQEQLEAVVQDRVERKTYAHRIFRLLEMVGGWRFLPPTVSRISKRGKRLRYLAGQANAPSSSIPTE